MIIDLAVATLNSLAFSILGYTVEAVKFVTYLGLLITENGSIKAKTQSRIVKATSIMARLSRSVWSIPELSTEPRCVSETPL
jgi:hypothetical protein